MLMRKLKSVSRFLVLILLFSLILPSGIVQADGKDARSTGTLTVHKYEQEPEAGAGEEGDGSADQQIPEDAEPVEGVEFTITMTHKYNPDADTRSEEHTSELQSRGHRVCRLLLDTKNTGQSRSAASCS